MCDPCCGPFEPRGCRSRELRCGILYTTCDCVKRNGLQDKCPRAACQGRPACMCFPFPSCGPASFPLRFANMTMGVNNKRMRCAATAATCAGGGGLSRACGGCCGGGGGGCGGGCGPCGGGGGCCGPCNNTPCCGPHSPPCGAPAPIPCSPAPGVCCPPLPEGGIPDPRVWNCCNTPPTYPCGF
ncbi:chorion class high-cysteine HCB protein 13 isoform X1 [Drosophila busckii]|uniref:chorion class high-cysteine HCB protein 13 isoform X1 n=2 Tax=Drosophila busckii TaxID=30019 RepID=UPI00083F3FC4|nr:chorion class high-cysteine HCB protein 13 isoform X1 [Drosophila busckii]